MNDKYAGKFHKTMKLDSQIKEEMDNYIKSKTMQKQTKNKEKKEKAVQEGSNKDNRLKAYFQLTEPSFDAKNKTQANTKIHLKHNKEQNEDSNTKKEKPLEIMTTKNGNTFEIVHEKVNIDDDYDINKGFEIDKKSLLEQFEEYYEEKFKPLERVDKTTKKEKVVFIESTKEKPPKMKPLYNISNPYLLGANILPNSIPKQSLFCFHKDDKWISYLNHNLIVIENFHTEDKREQIILKKHNVASDLSSIKLSNGGRILYAASNKEGVIIFYNYKSNSFDFINKYTIPNKGELHDYSISPMNNLCVILYNDVVSCIDFGLGEELISINSHTSFDTIQWNYFISEIEFCSNNTKNISFFTVNPKNFLIEEHILNVDLFKERKDKNEKIVSIDYTPPLSIKCVIGMIVALSNGSLFLIDYKENKILKYYTAYDLFLSESITISKIIVSMYFITIISHNSVKYFRLPMLSQVNYYDISLFSESKGDIEHDSEIISIDIDTSNPKGEGITMTRKGGLYYLNFREECRVRLFNFIPEETNIIKQCVLLNKNIKLISIQNMMSKQYKNRNDNKDVGGYYLVTSHVGGSLRIWNVPENLLIYNFEVNDEIELMQNTPNDLKVLVFYSSGNVRCFDIEKAKSSKKINIKNAIGENNNFKLCQFFPDGKYFIGVDKKYNHFYLATVESYEPLSMHFNQILNEVNTTIVYIGFHLLDAYNFFYTNNNKEISIYSRKFTKLIQDLSFEKSVPQYGKTDSFCPIDFCNDNNFNESFENHNISDDNMILQCSFSPLSYEKDNILILSKIHNIIILRDFKMRIVTKITKFDEPLLSFMISSIGDYILYVFPSKIKFTEFNNPEERHLKGNIISLKMLNHKKSFPVISQDNKYILLFNLYAINFFNILNKK